MLTHEIVAKTVLGHQPGRDAALGLRPEPTFTGPMPARIRAGPLIHQFRKLRLALV
jgi:hypothetical protein